MASTMVLARLLLDRGELHSRHGRVMIGITLVVLWKTRPDQTWVKTFYPALKEADYTN